jgi:biotin carboxyl carrier protein
MKYTVTVSGRAFDVEVDHDRLVWVNGRPLYVEMEQVGGLPVYSLALDDTGYVLFVEKKREDYLVEVQGQLYPVEVQLQRPRLGTSSSECPEGEGACLTINAPLPGRLTSLPLAAGDRVETGQVVAEVESMKMQMELKAPLAGIVEAAHGPVDRDVRQGEALVALRLLAEHDGADWPRDP